MTTNIFVNLPVKNLDRSVKFFTALGYTFNPQFTDETATCMIVSDTIYVMLLTEAKFRDFIPNPIADTQKTTSVIICLSCESREAVTDIVAKAVAAGAALHNDPQDHGFMLQHGFRDLDGHIWEYTHMNPEFVQ